MDAARIERIFGGGRLASTLLMGAFSLVFSGCGSSGAGASGASVVLPAGAPAPAVHSSLKSAATYGILVADGEKLIDVPMGTSLAVKTAQQKALAKVSTAPKNLYLRSDGTSSLVQRFRPSLTFPINYAFFKLRGNEEPFEAYVPEGFNVPTHSGVFPQDFQNYSSSQRIDVEWTLPVPGTGLFPDIALANVPQINLGGEIPITVPSTDRVHFVIDQSGGNQAITLDGVGEIYNGPQRFIIPWVSSFSPGLHRLKITVDGQEVANDSYMQRQLMFERPFPNSTDVVAGDVAITNTFGWTTDGATIDASLPLTSEFWTAGGSEQAAQFAPKNFNNQVSFTLNTLRETITKSLQPLTIPTPSSLAKELVANKTLGYSVLAHAQGYADYQIRGNGSVPGFKRLVMLSTVQQTPSPVAVDGNTTFEFDVTPVNFEEGVLNYGFRVGANGEEFVADNAGTVTTTSTGWHVSIPWKATPLSSTAGYLNLAVSEASDPRKYATAEQSFAVNLQQPQSDRTASVRILDVNPNPIKVEDSTDVTVHGRVSSNGMTNPSYSWTVSFFDDDGNLLSLVSGETADIAVTQTFSPYSFSTTSELTVHIDATVYDIDHPEKGALTVGTVSLSGGGTGGGTVGGGGSGNGTGSSNDVTVDVENLTKLTVHDSKSNKDVGLAFHVDRTKDSADQRVERRKLLRNIVPDNTSDWELRVDGLQFTDSDPAKIPAKVKAEVRSTISKAVMEVDLLREGQTLTFKSGKIGTPKDGKKLIKLDPPPGDSVPNANLTYAVVEAFAVDPIAQDLATKVMGFTEKIFPFPAVSLGTLSHEAAYADDIKPISPTDETDDNIEKVVPTIGSDGNDNFSAAGFEAVRIQITDPSVKDESKLTAVVKVAHGSEEYIVNLHGDHHGDLLLKEKETDSANYNVGQARMSEAIQTLFLVACDALDLHDYNGFYTYPHFPKDLDPELGYPADSGMVYSFKDLPGVPRTFGGRRWSQATSGNTDVLLGYAGPAPILSFRDVNTRFEYELRQTGLPRTDQRVLAWLRANRAVARQDFPGKGWLCLNACAWDKRAGKYYYIPYVPPGGVYYDPASLRRPGRLKMLPPAAVVGTGREMIEEFGIYEVPMSSDAVPAPDPRTGWQIPPETIGSRIEK